MMNYICLKNDVKREEVEMYQGEYFDWLCDRINLQRGKYDILIHELYNIDFTWVIELDSNRAEDGLILRGYFNTDDLMLLSKPCSVLEALIGLAERMDYIMDDEDRGDRTRIWFWEMIDNLGLNRYADENFDSPYGRDMDQLNDIHSICSRWLNREFDYAGNGSPFPLNNPHTDQRELHMIDQLNEYILDKHMFGDEIM